MVMIMNELKVYETPHITDEDIVIENICDNPSNPGIPKELPDDDF